MKKLCLVIAGLLILVLGNVSCTCPEKTLPPETILPLGTTPPLEKPPETSSPALTPPLEKPSETSSPALTPLPKEEAPPTYSLAKVVALLTPTVVRVETSEGSASGVIISRTGYVLTNSHVVEGATLARITLMSGEKYDGIVVARDEDRDLAIVGIIADRSDFPEGVLGSSENITVGEEVVAIGYALGLKGQVTVSKGIISAIRNVDGSSYIQTDAAINPGSSGGPLVNLKGEIIGINTAKYVGVAVESIGLAVPIDEAKLFIQDAVGK